MANIRDEMRAWVATATINIRFKPDREAVARELQEHIEVFFQICLRRKLLRER